MQLGALGNYHDKPPSEHMCFSPKLHKDLTWPALFLASHPHFNNRLMKSKKKKKKEGAEEQCARIPPSSRFFWIAPTRSATFQLSRGHSEGPALLSNRCPRIPLLGRRLLQIPDKLPWSRTHPTPHPHPATHLIESAYTCNCVFQPSDRSRVSTSDRDKLSPSLRPPHVLWIHYFNTPGLTSHNTHLHSHWSSCTFSS